MTAISTNSHMGATTLNIILPVALSSFAALSFSFNGTVHENESFLRQIIAESQGFTFIFFACAVMLSWISCKCWDVYRNNTCVNTKTVACLFSLCMIFGLSFSANNSWDFILGGKQQFVISLLVYGGYWYFFDLLVVLAYQFIHNDRLGLFSVTSTPPHTHTTTIHIYYTRFLVYLSHLQYKQRIIFQNLPNHL